MSANSINQFFNSSVILALKDFNFRVNQEGLNPRICGLLDDTVLEGGKRLRPLLTLAMCEVFGLSLDQGVDLALDIERIHAATLAHDDVVDAATLRRGRPSINYAGSNKKAILAGDYLLAQVMKAACVRGDIRIIGALSDVIADLVEGEWIQIENSASQELSRKNVELVAEKKTGSVLSWCCYTPAMAAGVSHDIISLIKDFGFKLGLIFQLGDDILDFRRQDGGACADLKNLVVSSIIYEILRVRQGKHLVDATLMQDQELLAGEIEQAVAVVRRRMHYLVEESIQLWREIKVRLEKSGTSVGKASAGVEALVKYLANRV